eukprot:12830330-Alexandrium_andersonii.AAC.1
MSASLVGSEMCIRDRGVPLCRLGVLPAVYFRILDLARPHPSRRRSAVSYTHLTLPTICSV